MTRPLLEGTVGQPNSQLPQENREVGASALEDHFLLPFSFNPSPMLLAQFGAEVLYLRANARQVPFFHDMTNRNGARTLGTIRQIYCYVKRQLSLC